MLTLSDNSEATILEAVVLYKHLFHITNGFFFVFGY